LPRFGDIAGFLLRTASQALFRPNFGSVPQDYIADVVAPRSEDPKLKSFAKIIRASNFEVVQPIHSGYVNITGGQTDKRTTYDMQYRVLHYVRRAVKTNKDCNNKLQ